MTTTTHGTILNTPKYETSKTLTINWDGVFYPVPYDYEKKIMITSHRVEEKSDKSASSTIYFQMNKEKWILFLLLVKNVLHDSWGILKKKKSSRIVQLC